MPSRPRMMIATCTSQNTANEIQMLPGTLAQPGPRRRQQRLERQRANPGLDAEPAARHDRPQHGRHVGALHAEGRAAQHRKRHAVLRAGVRVQDHRDQDDGVAEQDGDERLPPVHALLHQARGERVGGDHHAHADPERGDVIRGPRAARERRRREVVIPQRAARDVFGQLDEVAVVPGSPVGRHFSAAVPPSTGIPLGFMPAVVVLAVGPANLRVHHHVAAAKAAEVLERRVAALLHELLPCRRSGP